MTKQEIAKMFYFIRALYPQTFKHYGEMETKNHIDAWEHVFGSFNAELVMKATEFYVYNDTKGFAPSAGQIIECIHKLNPTGTMNEMEAWRLVEKAVRNSLYNAATEFEKLPQVIKRVVRDPGHLKDWAQMDLEEFQTIEQSNFMRAYRVEQQREIEAIKTPLPIRPALENIDYTAPMIEDKEEKETGTVPDADIDNMIERLRKWDAT